MNKGNRGNIGSNEERSKHDMYQASAMKGMSSSEDAKAKVNSSLRGLDDADYLVNKGHLVEARSMYESNIGTLIEVINKMKKSNNFSSSIGIDIDVLKERTRAALTDAENVKKHILEKFANDEMKITKDLNKLGVTMTASKGSSSSKTKKSQKMALSKISRGKSTSAIDSNSGAVQREETYNAISTSKSIDTAQSLEYRQHPRKRSNLNYNSNDPMITTIKNEMYVDSSLLSTTWKDIAGLVEAKQALQEAAILPLLRPYLFTGLRSAPKGILLYGPPGTGKTMLVKAVAHESNCILFACSASALTSKWVGESEKLIRTLFKLAADVAPSIVFLDEMDALLSRRKSDGNNEAESSRRFKTEFMVQMDGISAGSDNEILLIGATNCPWDIDDAILRRLQRRVYVPLPDQNTRLALWKKLATKSKESIKISEREFTELAKMTNGLSCSDIASTANEASFGPLRDLGGIEKIKDVKSSDVRPIILKDFKNAIKKTKKSVSLELLQRYDRWENAQSIND